MLNGMGREVPDEKDEEDGILSTDHEDYWAGTHISLLDEVVCFSVVGVAAGGGTLPVLKPGGGDVRFEPAFVHLSSWEEIDAQMKTACKQEPMLTDVHAAAFCKYCRSGIRPGELAIRAVFGELRPSEREPNGVRGTTTFEEMEESPDWICTSCGIVLVEQVVSLWDDPVQQHRECHHGTKKRCWRFGCPADTGPNCTHQGDT